MLLFIGILSLILAFVVFIFTAFAEGMSDAPQQHTWRLQWPAIALLGLAVICFVVRHFVHGNIHW